MGCSAPSRGCRARSCGYGAAAPLHCLGRPFLISVCPLRCGESSADVNVLSGGTGRLRSCLSRQCQPNTPPPPLPGSARQTQLGSPPRWAAVLATNTSTSVFSFFPTARGGLSFPRSDRKVRKKGPGGFNPEGQSPSPGGEVSLGWEGTCPAHGAERELAALGMPAKPPAPCWARRHVGSAGPGPHGSSRRRAGRRAARGPSRSSCGGPSPPCPPLPRSCKARQGSKKDGPLPSNPSVLWLKEITRSPGSEEAANNVLPTGTGLPG